MNINDLDFIYFFTAVGFILSFLCIVFVIIDIIKYYRYKWKNNAFSESGFFKQKEEKKKND